MKDLRVNSKTKINEFKRKHNWLVESSAIKLNVSDIKSLSNEDIENLNCGDIVLKEDASGKHAYLVSFKNETGMCLTYADASVIETQSYDKVGENWVYNSEDKTPNLLDVATKTEIENGDIENAKPMYWHTISFIRGDATRYVTFMGEIIILNNSPTPITVSAFIDMLKIPGFKAIVLNGRLNLNGGGDITNMTQILKYIEYYSSSSAKITFTNSMTDMTLNTRNNINNDADSYSYFEEVANNKIN